MIRALIAFALACQAAPAAAESVSACTTPEAAQLDFWLGEWDVHSGAERVATSRIERASGGCAIHEHYRQADGYEGQSLSFYDAHLRAWRQTWVDSLGGVGEFRGEALPGEMRFVGETHRGDGTRVSRRMTLTRITADRVRQYSLASTDDGRTWKAHYDFTYVRRYR